MMNLRDRVAATVARGLGYKARKPRVERPSYGTAAGDTLELFLPGWYSTEQLQRLAMQTAWFYSDIMLLARKMSQPKLNVLQVKGEGTEQVYDHPFERLFRRPNPLMSGSFLMQYTTAWLGLEGNAYWYLTQNGMGELAELWPLPARAVRPVPGPGGVNGEVLSHYAWKVEGREFTLPVEKVCHFRLANPFDVLKGVGLIRALRYELQGDLAMARWQLAFFDKKRAVPEALATLPQDTSNTDFDRVKAEAEREFGGGQRRMMWVRSGEIDIKQLGLSQKEMMFLATRTFTRETVDRVCGLPAGYWDKSATRANAEAAELALMRDTVAPTLKGIAGEVDAQVIDRFYEPDLTVAFDDVVPQDRRLAVTEFETYSPLMTVDEARAERNLPALEGELGATLVALVPALGQMMAGGLGNFRFGIGDFGLGARSSGLGGGDNGVVGREVRDELRNWQQVALKEVAKGRDPSARPFVCDWIPGHVQAEVEAGLVGVVDEEGVRQVFRFWV